MCHFFKVLLAFSSLAGCSHGFTSKLVQNVLGPDFAKESHILSLWLANSMLSIKLGSRSLFVEEINQRLVTGSSADENQDLKTVRFC